AVLLKVMVLEECSALCVATCIANSAIRANASFSRGRLASDLDFRLRVRQCPKELHNQVSLDDRPNRRDFFAIHGDLVRRGTFPVQDLEGGRMARSRAALV